MAGTGELFIHEHRLNLYTLARDLAEQDNELADILSQEEILNIVTGKFNRVKMSMKIYVFTDYATLISFTYNFQKPKQLPTASLKQHSIRHLAISTHLKQMTVFKLSKIVADRQYPLCMLIQKGIICYVASLNENTSLTAFGQGDLIVGLVECKINNPCELALSKNKKFVVVSNLQTVEIYQAHINHNNTSIILDLVLIVNYDSLPLSIDTIDGFAFSNSDNNVFYAIGRHNSKFYEMNQDFEEDSFGSSVSHKIEKFFIENEAFSSETIVGFILKF